VFHSDVTFGCAEAWKRTTKSLGRSLDDSRAGGMLSFVRGWHLADGTIVSLGGRVSGDSIVAEVLLGTMSDAMSGLVSSGYGAEPHIETLDVNVPHLLDHYLRGRFCVASGPDVEYPIEKPRPEPPEGAVY